jgi:hypothetical protein
MSTYNYPNAADTWFTRRNDAGVTIGYFTKGGQYFHGFADKGRVADDPPRDG